MVVIIGSHFVPLEGKFLLIAYVIARITINVIVRQMSAKQRCVHHSKTCCQTSLERFYNFISTGCEKVEEVFESLTTKWLPI